MDFAFSPEQEMLRTQAREFLTDRFGPDRVVALAEAETPFDRDVWSEIAGLGWTSLSIAEEHGGAGMGFLDEAVLFEELGYALFPGPFFSTVALALPALAGAGDLLSEIADGSTTATLAWAERERPHLEASDFSTAAERTASGWRLSGEKVLVPDLDASDVVVVAASADGGPGLWTVRRDTEGIRTEVSSTMDATRRLGSVALEGADCEVVVEPGGATDVFERVRLTALAALSLEAVGVAQKALELALDHAKAREQFDKPIGAYQAVSHQVADTYVDVELARSLAYWAAWTVAQQEDRAPVAVAAAKAAASEAAVAACERSIQVHGGIGFTWEHILHRYYKRAQWIESFDGFAARHRAVVAEGVI